MRTNPRVLVVVTALLAGSCSKPMAPAPSGVGVAPSADAQDVALHTVPAHAFSSHLTFRGPSVSLDANFRPRLRTNEKFSVTDHGDGLPDTVSAYSVLERVQWLPEDADVTSPLTSEAFANPGDPRLPGALPVIKEDAPSFAPGMHTLTLQAPEYAGGGEATVRFWAGFVPGSWWAGPDPDLWPASSDGDGRAVDVVDWSSFSTSPAWPPDGRDYFGPDSLDHIPSSRRPPGDDFERRTFYEIYGNRIYARREGDTVHLNSWIVLVHGGYDRDSPYTPRVVPTDPALPADFVPGSDRYPVLQALGLVGSPIGFKTQLTTKLSNGNVSRASRTSLYPDFDPASFLRNPVIAGYVHAGFAGEAYVVSFAQDSDGLQEVDVIDPIALVALVDAGGGTPAQRMARRRIIMFRIAPAENS